MKGHVFDLLEQFVKETLGEAALYEILDECSFDTSASFVRSAVYPDAYLVEIVDGAVRRLGITVEEAHFAFGKWIIPRLAELLPGSFEAYDDPCSFLAGLDDLHQVSLKKIYPDAEPPRFSYEAIDANCGVIRYRSPRRLFHFMEGCLHGVAEQYRVDLKVVWSAPETGDECDFRIECGAR